VAFPVKAEAQNNADSLRSQRQMRKQDLIRLREIIAEWGDVSMTVPRSTPALAPDLGGNLK